MVHVKHRGVTWRQIIDLVHSQKSWMMEQIADLDITPQMAQALHAISENDSLTMSSLAGELFCDASNTTGIVDRLEARQLVERRASESDRRVKIVVLTATGRRMRKRIEDCFDDVPPALAALSAADQRTMREILVRAMANVEEQRATK